MIATAGSVLLFSETLIHATGQVRSDRERLIIIFGYATRLFPWWDGFVLSEEFLENVPEPLKTLIHGERHWAREPKYRTLDDQVDQGKYSPVDWPDWTKNS